MKIRKEIYTPILFTEYNPIEVPTIFEEWVLIELEDVIKNYYWISNFGRLKNKNGSILKPTLINSGYYVYRLYTGNLHVNRYKHMLAHRLVKIFFDPIPEYNNYTVNHDDMDKSNNCNYNLSWMTQAENNIHKQRNLIMDGSRNYQALFTHSQLIIIVKELNKGTSYKDILNLIGLDNSKNNRDYISNIKRGITYQREIKNILNE